jgi:hypothetical protein
MRFEQGGLSVGVSMTRKKSSALAAGNLDYMAHERGGFHIFGRFRLTDLGFGTVERD